MGGFRAIRGELILVVLIVIVTAAVYAPVAGFQFVSFDDNLYVTHNRAVQVGLNFRTIRWALTTSAVSYWHPLTWMSHMLDVSLFKMWAGGHHLHNLLLHLANSALLFALLRYMTGSRWRSAFVAAAFALHPMHVESVAWVAERKDVLSTFFALLTLLAYAKYARSEDGRWLMAALALFVAGLASKPMLVTLPVLMLLLDIWPLRRSRMSSVEATPASPDAPPAAEGEASFAPTGLGQLLMEKAPFLGAALLCGLLTIMGQSRNVAMSGADVLTVPMRLANAAVAYVQYLSTTFWPAGLAFFYPYVFTRPWWHVAGSAVLLVAVSAACLLVIKRRPVLAVGWFWFLIALLPVIGLFQAGIQAMADRFSYLPHIGLFMAVAWLAGDLAGQRRAGRVTVAVLAVVVVAAMTVLTWRQVPTWRDNFALYGRALAVTEGNYVAHNNIGLAYWETQQYAQAVHHFVEALAVLPGYQNAQQNLSGSAGGLENMKARTPDLDAALALAHRTLGEVHLFHGRYAEAQEHLLRSLQLEPDNAQAREAVQRAAQGLPPGR